MSLHRVTDPRVDVEDLDSRRDRVDLVDLALDVRSKLSSLETLAADAQRLAHEANELAKTNAAILELLGGQLGEVRERLGEFAGRMPSSRPPSRHDWGEVTQTRILEVLDRRETEKDAAALRKMKGFGWRLPAAAALAAVGLVVKLLWVKIAHMFG